MSRRDADGEGPERPRSDSPTAADPGGYHAFVSYARVDADVARRLREQLRDRGLEAWLDVEGIDPGQEWMARIARVIEACAAVVVLITPESLASKVCRAELQQAVELGTLIVPVLHRDVDRGSLPAELAGEAVPLRDGDPWEPGLEALVATLKCDLPWRERHAQLAVRARRWSDVQLDATGASRASRPDGDAARRRDPPGYLLRGAELREAEVWLGERGLHAQAPTAVHDEFIVASRRAAGRLQRTQLGAALVALLVTGVLTVVAVLARNATIDDSRVARSRALAAQAVVVAEKDPGLAAALSLEAGRVKRTPQARRALDEVLPRLGDSLGELRGHLGEVTSVATSPDGATLASASEDGTLRLWDRATRAAIGAPLRGHSGAVWRVAFSPDAKTLASGGADGTLRLWSVAGRRPIVPALRGHRKAIRGVAFSPDGKTVASAGADGTLRLWNLATRRQAGAPLGRPGTVPLLSVAFSPGGRLLATAAADGGVDLWDVAGRRRARRPPQRHRGKARAVAFAHDGKTLASGDARGIVRLWRVESQVLEPAGSIATAVGREVDVLGAPADIAIRDLAFAPRGGSLAVAGDGVRLWDVATRRARGPVLPVQLVAPVTLAVAFTADARTLVTGGPAVGLWNVAPRGDSAPASGSLQHIDVESELIALVDPGHLTFSPDSGTLAVTDFMGTVGLWNVETRTERARIELRPTGIGKAAFSPDGRVLATAGGDGAVRFFSPSTRRRLGAPLRGHRGRVVALAFGPGGRRLATAGEDGTVRLWSVARRRRLGAPLGGGGGLLREDIAFSPDGRLLASADSMQRLRLSPIVTRSRAASSLEQRPNFVVGFAFHPDGRLLATANSDGSLRLWDVATRRPSAPLRGHVGPALRVAFSPDGTTLASSGMDGTVRLWSVATRRPIGAPLRGDAEGALLSEQKDDAIVSLAFSPNGGKLASVGGGSFTAWLWDPVLWTGSLHARRVRACAAGRRNLSRAEWRRYLPGEAYRETCPGA